MSRSEIKLKHNTTHSEQKIVSAQIREKKDVRLGPSVHKCFAIYTSFSGAPVSVAGQGTSRWIRHFSDERSCNSCSCHHILCTNCNISTCYRGAYVYWVNCWFCLGKWQCFFILFFITFLSIISFRNFCLLVQLLDVFNFLEWEWNNYIWSIVYVSWHLFCYSSRNLYVGYILFILVYKLN